MSIPCNVGPFQVNEDTQIINDCGGCVFGEFDGNAQTGCLFGVIDKLKSKNYEILSKTEDEMTTFYFLDKLCPYRREQAWSAKHALVVENGKALSLMEVAHKEITLKYDLIIYVSPENTLEDMQKTLDSVALFELMPTNVIIALAAPIRPSQVIPWMKEHQQPYPWQVEFIIEQNCTKERAVQIASDKCKTIFMMVAEAPKDISPKYTKKIRDYIYEDLNQVILIHNGQDWHKTFIFRKVFMMAGGNANDSIINKIKRITEQQKQTSLIVGESFFDEKA